MSTKVIVDQQAWQHANELAKENDLLRESEKWDNRELGADEQFAVLAPDSVQEELKNITK